MRLVSLDFTFSIEDGIINLGTIVYLAPNEFPDHRLQVNFLADLTVDEVMVID